MKKVLMIIGGIVVGLVVLGVIVFTIISATSSKLVCESTEGNITIMYNDKTLTGYTTKNINYDLNGQKKYAEQIGVKAILQNLANGLAKILQVLVNKLMPII